MATATPRKRTRRAAAANVRRRSVARRSRAPSGPDAGTIATWAGFALVGLVIAAGVAALLVDDVPFEDRHLRDVRHRLRDRASHASADAIEALSRQFADLRGDVQRRIADLR
ncbi:MAG: hypothetical protein JSR81_01495 [Proteobacteria bacterium]|nr:hypothetical protein [Pseudomonadota bacterium]